MPLYPYTCPAGHSTEARRPVDERDAPLRCPCGALAARRPSLPQRPIHRPLGFALKPGDAGYWDFETPEGRVPRPSVAPFAKAEELYAHPPTPADDDDPAAVVTL